MTSGPLINVEICTAGPFYSDTCTKYVGNEKQSDEKSIPEFNNLSNDSDQTPSCQKRPRGS